MKGRCLVGTSGWSYKHWKGVFYPVDLPPSSWLSFYVKHFVTVEINNTFYHLPSTTTFETWERVGPTGFVFAVKASRYITHVKRLRDAAEPVANFTNRARLLGRKLGPVLYQLPTGWKADLPRLASFLELLPKDIVQSIEFRDESWFNDQVYELLEKHGVSFCIISLPGFRCPLKVTSPVVYIRMHGSQALYSRYSGEELEIWADHIAAFTREGQDVYVYFNNDAHGYAVFNATELHELLAKRGENVVSVGQCERVAE